LVPVKLQNFDFGPWVFLSVHQKKIVDVSPKSNMVSATSLNPCHIMVFFAHILNEGLNPMGLNFTGTNWMDFYLQGPKSKLENFTGIKSTFYPTKFESNQFYYVKLLLMLSLFIRLQNTKVR
jgi:hypothetical protein